MAERPAFFPGRAPIDAYGNGGFRFAGMSHRGSLLLLPSGVRAWQAVSLDDLDAAEATRIVDASGGVDHMILGTGRALALPRRDVRAAFEATGIRLDPMDTGAACRTYNILLAEGRAIGAALIAVD